MPSENNYPRLLGDVGGTHARFALIKAPGVPIENIATLESADYAGPADAIRAYLAQNKLPTPRSAAIGIANPITGDAIHMTNHSWAFSIEAERKSLGLERLIFINDFTALALSLPQLTTAERQQIGGGQAEPRCAIGVIGPGTGLGVSGLVPNGNGYIPLQGEGGHVTLTTQSAEEAAMLAVLTQQYSHVSAERVLSGIGLPVLYRGLATVRGQTPQDFDAPAITTRAVQGSDALCVDTCNMFCALLGTTAANLALTLGARSGVFIGGGIVPKLGNFFSQSPFRTRFETKGRFSEYLARIPTFVITAEFPALTGAAAALEHPLPA